MRRIGSLAIVVAALLAGCSESTESAAPGAKGPVILRVWSEQARQTGGLPTVLVTDALHQDAGGFDRLMLEPVAIRHPLRDGMAWIQAPKGRYQSDGSLFRLEGPVHFHGHQGGQWFSGIADRAEGSGGQVVLYQAELVRGFHVATTPRLVLNDGRIAADGPFLVAPGTPAVAAAIAAWE